MNPETDAVARDCGLFASAFADSMTFARLKSLEPAERLFAASKAMMSLHLMEREVAELKRLMPRSWEEGVAMAKDLQEVAG